MYNINHLQFEAHAQSDIPLILPASDELVMDHYLGHGLQAGEAELPEENSCKSSSIKLNPKLK